MCISLAKGLASLQPQPNPFKVLEQIIRCSLGWGGGAQCPFHSAVPYSASGLTAIPGLTGISTHEHLEVCATGPRNKGLSTDITA